MIESIRSAMASGRTADALALAHTLKGSAATVGATTLAERAARVESALRNGTEPSLDDLEAAAAEARESAALFVASLPDVPRQEIRAGDVDAEAFAGAMAELDRRLARSSLDADRILPIIASGLAGQIGRAHV